MENDLLNAVNALFAEEEVQTKAKVHYLRFDDSKIKLANGEQIILAKDAWQEICTFLRTTEPKEMVKRLYGLARLANRRKVQKQLAEENKNSNDSKESKDSKKK